jgi:hypothetical protein
MTQEVLVGQNTVRLVEAWGLINSKPVGAVLSQILEIATTLVTDQQQGNDIYVRRMDGSRALAPISGRGPASALADILRHQNDKEPQGSARISEGSAKNLGVIAEHMSNLGYTPDRNELLGAVVQYVFDLKLETAAGANRLEIRKGQGPGQPRNIEGLNW